MHKFDSDETISTRLPSDAAGERFSFIHSHLIWVTLFAKILPNSLLLEFCMIASKRGPGFNAAPHTRALVVSCTKFAAS